MNAKPEIIVDKDITLKRFSHDADQQKFDLIVKNHDHLLPWLPWANFYHEISDMEQFTSGQIAKFDTGATLGYDIFYHDTLVGSLDLQKISTMNHNACIGYWLDQDHTGKGIMTRAVDALTKYSFNELNLHRVSIEVAPENTASVAVAKRLDFKYEATLREAQLLDEKYYDTEVYTKFNKK